MRPVLDSHPLADAPFYCRPPAWISGWLTILWSQVLFPGRSPATEPVRLSSLGLLIFVPGVLLYACMSFHLFEPDEGRYAEIPREMMVRGEWTVPYLDGEPYLDKPPLLYWLVAISYRIFGVHAWSARLVPALAIHACILVVYLMGRRLFGERAAFLGALLLALAPGFITIGRLLVLDGLLALWVTLSLFAAFEAVRRNRLAWPWWLLSALACGLGILTKGPVAIVLLAPPLWAYRALQPNKCAVRWPAYVSFVAVTLAVAAPWYAAICVRLPAFAYHFLWEHNVVRFLAPFDHLRPIWFYGPILFLGLLPATLLLVPFCRFLLATDQANSARRPAELGFTLLAGCWCVAFFSLSGCKLPTYIMPAFPPFCLAFGFFLTRSRWHRSPLLGVLGTVGFAVICLGHNLLLPWYAAYRAPAGHLAELRNYCGDPAMPVICYPRSCDSVAFYVGRDDLKIYRSKETNALLYLLQKQERPAAVLLFTHRHSLEAFKHALTPDLEIVEQRHFGLQELQGLPKALAEKMTVLMGETSLGLCDLAVVQRKVPESSSRARISWR
jgi:hypothetical protein